MRLGKIPIWKKKNVAYRACYNLLTISKIIKRSRKLNGWKHFAKESFFKRKNQFFFKYCIFFKKIIHFFFNSGSNWESFFLSFEFLCRWNLLPSFPSVRKYDCFFATVFDGQDILKNKVVGFPERSWIILILKRI